MKLTFIAAALAAIITAAPAVAQSVTSPSGVVLIDDLPRPDTWLFHEQYRGCNPNTWDAPVNSNVWTNYTCQSLTNSSLESQRARRAARDAVIEEPEGTDPVEEPDTTDPVEDTAAPSDEGHDAGEPETIVDAPPAGDKPNCNASANNGRGGNGGCDNGRGNGRGRG
jgi:hypothetical protein